MTVLGFRRTALHFAAACAIAFAAMPVYAQDAMALVETADQAMDAGDHAAAERAYAEAVDLLASTRGEKDPDTVAVMRMLAMAQFSGGDMAAARATLSDRLVKLVTADTPDSDAIAEAKGDVRAVTKALAQQLDEQGRYADAEPHWRALVADDLDSRGEADPETLFDLTRLATNLKIQGRPSEAEPILRQALTVATETLGPDDGQRLMTMNDLGRTLEQLQRHVEAERLYREAAERATAKDGPDAQGTLIFRGNLSQSLLYQGRFEEAEPIIRDTLERRTRTLGEKHPQRLYSLSDLGLVLMALKKFDEARPVFEELVPLSEQVFGPNHPTTLQVRNSYSVTLQQSGSGGEEALAEARAVVERLRARRQAIGNSAGAAARDQRLTENDSFYFKTLLQTLYEVGEQQPERRPELLLEGFAAMQEVMDSPASLAVAKRAARAAAAESGPELAALVDERERLAQVWLELAKARNEALATTDAKSLAAAEEKLRASGEALTAVDTQLKEKFPAYFDLIQPRPLNYFAAQNLFLDTEDAALLVLPTPLGTHVMLVADGQMNWWRSEYTERDINMVVRRLLWDVSASVDVSPVEDLEWSEEGEGAYPFDRALAFFLYRELVEPFADQIDGKRHLYIAAAGSLSSLPFGMLVTEQPSGIDGDPDDLRATKWLADKHALIQLPSLQSLHYLRSYAMRDVAGEGFRGFGDPALEGEAQTRGGGTGSRQRGPTRSAPVAASAAFMEDGSGSAQVDLAALRRMARLPGTRAELEQLRQAFAAPDDALTMGVDATETAIKQADLQGYAVLALATHGLLAGEVPGAVEPGLVFTPPATATAADDGLLTMSEIAGLSLAADWVILSACNTAAGDGSEGAPGLSGIAKSFFFAGARTLVASHWPVRDDVASLLMVRMIEIAREKPELSKAEALQLAMREIRNDAGADAPNDTWAHPNAWAPFTLIGDAGGGEW